MDKNKIIATLFIGGITSGCLLFINKLVDIYYGIPTRKQLKELEIKKDICKNYNEAVKEILKNEEEGSE